MNKKTKILIYIAYPISGNISENLLDLVRIIKKVNLRFPDMAFCAPYYADIISLDDTKPEERERGIENDRQLILSGCFDELWLTGNKISNGMHEKIKLFQANNKLVVNLIGKI